MSQEQSLLRKLEASDDPAAELYATIAKMLPCPEEITAEVDEVVIPADIHFSEDISTEIGTGVRRGFSRREILGLKNTPDVTPLANKAKIPLSHKKRIIRNGLALTGIAALGFAVVSNATTDENSSFVVHMKGTITEPTTPTTSTEPVATTTVSTIDLNAPIIITTPTNEPEITVASTIAPTSVETTLPPTTTPPANEVVVAPVETHPPDSVPPETVPPTTIDLYAGVDCSAETTILLRGMTPSQLAEKCRLKLATLQTYNPDIDFNTEFITGTEIRLRPVASSGSENSQTNTSCGRSNEVVKSADFTPWTYLTFIGLSPKQITDIVTKTSFIDTFKINSTDIGKTLHLPNKNELQCAYAGIL